MRKYYITILLLFLFYFGFSQNTILCPQQKSSLKIENAINIPIITNNNDGTITLTHLEQNITDIFSNYIIYDFYQTKPNGSENAQKFYKIEFQTKDLMNELITSVTDNTFIFEGYFEGLIEYSQSTPIDSNLISFLDGKIFDYRKYLGLSDGDCPTCPLDDVPEDFSLQIEFTYDSVNDLLIMETINPSTCGNSFFIALKGGTVSGTLQLWESTPMTISESTFDQTCYQPEDHLFSMLDIACPGINFGDIIPTIDLVENTLILKRGNFVFGTDRVLFESESLSINESFLNELKIYQTENSPYLQISNSNNDLLFAEIYSISGQQVLKKTSFEDNKILINQLSNNLYFIRVFDSQSQFKVFKFLKR